MARERWGSRLGIIMAVAGSAIGLGNFLRFPGLVAENGGGAFMIPYFICLFLVGLPLMWVEWTIGRLGGGFGHSTAPGAFHTMWNKNRFIKYFGVIGIFGPMIIYSYYVFVESWLLGYTWFAITGAYNSSTTLEGMRAFQSDYTSGSGMGLAYFFFLVTFGMNVAVIYFGIHRGIERVCKYALPALLLLAIVLVIRVFTLGTPDPALPQNSAAGGLNYFWHPDWLKLWDAKVWVDAAGQILFTLSLGNGVILCYASYLTPKDDVALSGLTAASANEFAEVILGGSIVIPAAFIFMGAQISQVQFANPFDLAVVTMPLVLQKMAFGQVLGVCWFALLFLAGITSSISLAQPAISFLQDEFGLSKRRAVLILSLTTFVLAQEAIFSGAIGEMDFWGGRMLLVLFAAVEVVLFAWVFGMQKAWTELHVGSDITIPRIYRRIIKYVTPLLLLGILGYWLATELLPTLKMTEVQDGAARNSTIRIRLMMLTLFLTIAYLVRVAWKRRSAVTAEQRSES